MTGWWFGTFGLFFHILGIIIPTDFIFFRGVGIPPTRWNNHEIAMIFPKKTWASAGLIQCGVGSDEVRHPKWHSLQPLGWSHLARGAQMVLVWHGNMTVVVVKVYTVCFKGFWFEQPKGFHGFFGFWNRTFIGFDRIPWDFCPPKLCFRPTETNLFFGHAVCVMHHNPTSYRLGRSFMGHCPIRRPSAVHESVVSRFESWKGKEDVPWEHHGTTSSGWWWLEHLEWILV